MNAREPLRHLDLRHLRQLVVVAEKRSIRAAAKVLAIRQPALSRSIRALEEELGNKLLVIPPAPQGLMPNVGFRARKQPLRNTDLD